VAAELGVASGLAVVLDEARRAVETDAWAAELRDTRPSEQQDRLIDHDKEAAMERKKRGGYF
jgi:hypothetical protein